MRGPEQPGRLQQGTAAAGPSTGTAQAASANGRPRRSMITYALDGETATPLEQVSEILPFRPRQSCTCKAGHHVMGLLDQPRPQHSGDVPEHADRLSRPAACEGASVLVVETEGGLTGFAVPALQTIEAADWEPELPRHGQGQPDALAQALGSRKLAPLRHRGPPAHAAGDGLAKLGPRTAGSADGGLKPAGRPDGGRHFLRICGGNAGFIARSPPESSASNEPALVKPSRPSMPDAGSPCGIPSPSVILIVRASRVGVPAEPDLCGAPPSRCPESIRHVSGDEEP